MYDLLKRRILMIEAPQLVTFGALGAMFGVIRAYMQGEKRSILRHGATVGISVAVSVVSGFAATSLGFQEGIVFAIVAISALTSESLVAALIKIGDSMESDPVAFITKIIPWWKK